MPKILAYLPIAFYGLALILGLAGVALPGGSSSLSALAQWMLLAALGLQSLWAALGHAFESEAVAASIGWKSSPFQHEVAAANLGIGLAAIAAAFLGEAAAWAVSLMAASFLWGAAWVHIRDMRRAGNYAINNAGPIFWWDLLTPATLLLALGIGP